MSSLSKPTPAQPTKCAKEFLRYLKTSYTILHAEKVIDVRPGQLLLFWASYPHQAIHADPNHGVIAMHIPLGVFLKWNLPESFIQNILSGEVSSSKERSLSCDHGFFQRWYEDLFINKKKSPLLSATLMAELHGRLFRLACESEQEEPDQSPTSKCFRMPEKLEKMSAFISANFKEPITATHVCQHVHLHPAYATKLFKGTFGMSLKTYLTTRRLAYASQLLATTDLPVIEIAYACGFQTVSRFYAAFQQTNQMPPLRYRKIHRH